MNRINNDIKNKVILVTGGCRSGKSEFAENLLKDENSVLYIATAITTDKEMEERIKLHKVRRKETWITYEGYKDLDLAVENFNGKFILLDCVTIMITNLMFEHEINFEDISLDEKNNLLQDIKYEFEKLILKSKKLNKTLILVTNEVGLGLISEYKISRLFVDFAGIINQFIAELSDEVYFVACGLPLRLK